MLQKYQYHVEISSLPWLPAAVTAAGETTGLWHRQCSRCPLGKGEFWLSNLCCTPGRRGHLRGRRLSRPVRRMMLTAHRCTLGLEFVTSSLGTPKVIQKARKRCRGLGGQCPALPLLLLFWNCGAARPLGAPALYTTTLLISEPLSCALTGAGFLVQTSLIPSVCLGSPPEQEPRSCI